MIRRAVVCPCLTESPACTDDARRALGWRLVDVDTEPHGSVLAWVCPSCAAMRLVRLRAS